MENLSKTYGKGENKVVAIDNVSFSVQKGEFVAIVGASGSGKSTLLHLIGGVDRPTSGKVFIDGKDIYQMSGDNLAIFRRRQVGLIYQFYNLIPILNVEENITLPCDLDNKKVDKTLVKEIQRIDNYLEQILYYIRSENTEVDYIIKKVDLNKVIRDVLLKNKDILLERGIDVVSDAQKLQVLTDYKWLEFMINQVISNSMKYMRDILNKKIEIKAYKQENSIVLEIFTLGMYQG